MSGPDFGVSCQKSVAGTVFPEACPAGMAALWQCRRTEMLPSSQRGAVFTPIDLFKFVLLATLLNYNPHAINILKVYVLLSFDIAKL